MVCFQVKPFHGKERNVVHWAVFILNRVTNQWVFCKSFSDETKAQEFVEKATRDVEESCTTPSYLTLRTF